MRIDRSDLLERLYSFVVEGNGVVVGRPGVGKSYLFAELHPRLTAAGIPHVLLPVEALGEGGEDELRSLLNASGSVTDHLTTVLAAKPDVKGVILLDAFDAVRSEDSRVRLVNLIRRLIAASQQRWSVVVSVREYDARKSQALLKLFGPRTNEPPGATQDPRIGCRHLVVPPLTSNEVAQAVAQIPGLDNLSAGASEDFKLLLTIPFNLWLLEKVLSSPGAVPDVSRVHSEVQLLGLFWDRRIRNAENADDRELLLTRVTSAMIRDRTLSARKDSVYTPDLQDALSDLRSAEVLIDTPGAAQRLSFAHNTLFDYGVSVLQLEDLPQSVADFVAADPARPLFLRPSLTYYFTRLWHDSPESFWKVLWSLVPYDAIHVRLVARLIPPAVIASEARTIDSLQPLIGLLDEGGEPAREIVRRLLQALRINRKGSARLWTEFASRVANPPHRQYVWDLTTVTAELLDSVDEAEREPTERNANTVGSLVLAWVLNERKKQAEPSLDSLAAVWALPMVVRTFGADPGRSSDLVRAVLKLTQEPDFPIQYIFRLSDGVDHIVRVEPSLAAEIYRLVFAHDEQSTKETSFGTPVLPLISNRRQDFEMCRYSLAQHFPVFMASSPLEAARAAIESVNAHVIDKWLVPYLRPGARLDDLTEEFSFRGRAARCLPDTGHLRDLGRREGGVDALGEGLFSYLEKNAASPLPAVTEQILDLIADRSKVAYFWRELLSLGTKRPETFANLLFELSLARPIQLGGDTMYELGEFIRAAVPHYSSQKRAALEQSLLTLPEDADVEDRDRYERVAARLLACLPKKTLETDQAREYRAGAEREGPLPANEPPEGVSVSSRSYTEDDWLQEQGVDLAQEENATIRGMFKEIDEFVTAWRNLVPDTEAIERFLPTAVRAQEVAGRYDKTADATIQTSLWTKLAGVASAMSRSVGKLSTEARSFCRDILLRAAKHQEPLPNPEGTFDFPMWSPAPRNEAAQGLPWLTLSTVDKEILDAIASLAADAVPSVRFLVAGELFRLRWSAHEAFWQIMQERAMREDNRSVLNGLCTSLTRLPKDEDDRIADVLTTIQGKGLFPSEKSDFGDTFAMLVTRLGLSHENQWAMNALDSWKQLPDQHGELLHHAVFQAVLAINPSNLSSAKLRPTSLRAAKWLLSVLEGTMQALRSIRPTDQAEWTEERTKKFKEAYSIVDEIVSRLYYNIRHREGTEEITSEATRDYYLTIKPLLETVTLLGRRDQRGIVLAPTAHHFMQLMNEVLAYEPKAVLHMAADVAEASEAAGYNIDSIAIKEVVTLVESVLADYRNEVQEGEALADLLRLLDVFAKAGWPQALQLVWRLDEVFR